VTRRAEQETGRQIRGSLLLLSGRLLSLGVNFAVQVIIVRHLTKSDYGAFAYGLTVASLGSNVALLGLDRVLTVFVSMYHEHREYGRLSGTIAVIVGTTLPLSALVVLLVIGLRGFIESQLGVDRDAMALLTVLIALVPIHVIDVLIAGAFAIAGSAGSIFLRKYLLAPGFRLLAAIFFVATGSDVHTLAFGYVGAAAVSVLFCAYLLFRMVSGAEVLQVVRGEAMAFPVKKVFGFTLPLVVSDLRVVFGSAAAVLVVEHFHGTVEVAALRGVMPVALLNAVVFQSFKPLFMPLASRLVARQDHRGLNDLYGLSTVWIAVLTFPVFLATFAFSRSCLLTLYGPKYEQAALMLSVLSAGYYFSAALGFNCDTLRILGRSRYIVTVDLVGAVSGLVLTLLLTPHFGALGGALSISAMFIGLNACYQVGLANAVGSRLLEWRWFRTYLLLAVATLSSSLVQYFLAPRPILVLALAAVVSLVVLKASLASLDVENTFPQVVRHPLARRFLLGARSGAAA